MQTADPAYREWTCANLAEAFPGPMTPLSLHLARESLANSADRVVDLVGVSGALAVSVRSKLVGVLGHRLYQNISVLQQLVGAIPGQTHQRRLKIDPFSTRG